MLNIILFILGLYIFFKIAGLLLHIAGKLLGAVLTVIGWLVIAWLAVTVFRLALVSVPILLAVAIAAIVTA